MWEAKSKYDLIMEVWEKLDCESVGRRELEAIETVVGEIYGMTPQDTPMRLARLLADEGAELRHSELLELDVERRTATEDLPLISQPVDISDRQKALESIRELEELRRKFDSGGKADGVRALRKKAIAARDQCLRIAKNPGKADKARSDALDIAEWLSIWIQSPQVFETWIKAKFPEGFDGEAK